MREKLTDGDLDRLLTELGILERLSKIDLGRYYPISTPSGQNPFAMAFNKPGVPVDANVEIESGTVNVDIVWVAKREKPRDLMAEQARRRSASGSLAAAGKKTESSKNSPSKSERREDRDDLGLEPSELDSQGAFRLTVQNPPEGFELHDVQFKMESCDDQPITPVMRTGEVIIPDRVCDEAITSLDSKAEVRITRRGPSRAPRKQTSLGDEGADSQDGIRCDERCSSNDVPYLTYREFDEMHQTYSKSVSRICNQVAKNPKLLAAFNNLYDAHELANDVSQMVWLKISKKPIDGFPFEFYWHRNMRHIRLVPACVRKLAHDYTMDLVRRLKFNTSLETPIEDVESIDPADICSRVEDLKRLKKSIDQLGDRQRTAIELYYNYRMTYQEAADEMEITLVAFKSLIFRAILRLKKLYKEMKQ